MKRYAIALILCLMAAAFASDRPDTIVGQWVIEVEDSTAVIREMTEDGWYTAKFIVPRGGKPGDTIMIARVRLGERGVFIRHGGDLQQLQQDVQMTQDLLWQIKAKMDSAEKKP